ncbi:PREDICTED: clathrin light chain A-like [Chrysochloris asiatica]|uniref:Clathrin light chain n=1 Tax=Chrysochloris asiatica TaxID=185453 RepID=A0A9B0TDX4_CHRAS|nr:PREDICTED: clathrin light chain A-like [Chrysochloris asiatica]
MEKSIVLGKGVSGSVGLSPNVRVCAIELPSVAEVDPFGSPASTPGGPTLGNGLAGEEGPAEAFLAQQESEIAGIENHEALAILDSGALGLQPHSDLPGIQMLLMESRVEREATKELEKWYARQVEQLQKTKANNRAAEEVFVNDIDESSSSTEWKWVIWLCDFNPKSSKQAKDISCMRSVLISLKQAPQCTEELPYGNTASAIS